MITKCEKYNISEFLESLSVSFPRYYSVHSRATSNCIKLLPMYHYEIRWANWVEIAKEITMA